MDVPHEAPLRRDPRKLPQRLRPFLHRPLEMRDAAHDIHAHVERPDHVVPAVRRPVEPVLREGHELQVDVPRHPPLHLQHRLHAAQVVRRRVHMRPDREKPHRRRPVAIGDGAVHHLLHRRDLAQLPQSEMPSSSVPEAFTRGSP